MNTTDTIKKILRELGVDDWIIREEHLSSREYFFIRKDLDMNRGKDVKKYHIALYRHFMENGRSYKGSAQVTFPAQSSREEIIERLEKAWYAASFVRNLPYPMAQPEKISVAKPKSQLLTENPGQTLSVLRRSLYKNDIHREGGINSAEIFLSSYRYRLLSSTGIDEEFSREQGDIELICDWKDGTEDVEIYNMFSFADSDGELLERECREQIENCRLRSVARKAPELKNINIILTGDAVEEMMGFYLMQSSAKGVYEKIARGKIGEIFQGNDTRGDRITITLDPALEGSSRSVPFDEEGTALRKTEVFRDGKLLTYHGDQQYSSYMGVPPTGRIRNRVISGGAKGMEEWKRKPHVEIRQFSDFQMDPMTGDFGGEVRLALWFDGENTTPLTGASLSANIFSVQKEFYLSRECIRKDSYYGPAALMYPGGHLAG